MTYSGVKCFGCHQYGHIERDCPEKQYAAELGDGDKPPWCGRCDRVTRNYLVMTADGEKVRRCETCHPSGHLLQAQFKRCGECKSVIYEWDLRSECGRHMPVGQHRVPLERKTA